MSTYTGWFTRKDITKDITIFRFIFYKNNTQFVDCIRIVDSVLSDRNIFKFDTINYDNYDNNEHSDDCDIYINENHDSYLIELRSISRSMEIIANEIETKLIDYMHSCKKCGGLLKEFGMIK